MLPINDDYAGYIALLAERAQQRRNYAAFENITKQWLKIVSWAYYSQSSDN